MHVTDPERLPDIENRSSSGALEAAGFEWMRREHLLDPKRRFELINGLVLHRSDHSQRHDRVVAELARRLAEADVNEQLEVTVDRELRFEALDAVVTPDIVVSLGVEVPSLIVEVSDHAPRLDGMEKARLYARAGVEQYWHIDLAWTMLDVQPPARGWLRHARRRATSRGVPDLLRAATGALPRRTARSEQRGRVKRPARSRGADFATKHRACCASSCPHEYLRLRIDLGDADVFSYERVPLPSAALPGLRPARGRVGAPRRSPRVDGALLDTQQCCGTTATDNAGDTDVIW